MIVLLKNAYFRKIPWEEIQLIEKGQLSKYSYSSFIALAQR